MKKIQFKISIAAALLCMSFTMTPVQAASSVGKVIISIGKVFTTDKVGVEKKLKRRGKVFEGDTIKVGKKSRLQLRFIDNQLIVLKSNTIFRIDEYKFKDKNDKNKSAVVSLLKGGMRSVTGLIGKSARDKYKVKTPVATMGVRGTHYVLEICSSNCGDGVKGIVGTVLQGSIVMTNDAGTQEFGTDQFFNVPSMDQAPKTIVNPPAILISRAPPPEEGDGEGDAPPPPPGEGESDGEGDAPPPPPGEGDGTLAEGDAPPPPPGDDAPPPPPPSGDGGGTFSSSEQGTVTTTTGTTSTSPSGFIPGSEVPAPILSGIAIAGRIDTISDGSGGSAGVEGFNAAIDLATVDGVGNQPVVVAISSMDLTEYSVISGAAAIDTGGIGGSPFSVNWGRWASTDVVFKQNGTITSLDPDVGLAFAYSPDIADPSFVSGFVGSADYDLTNGPAILDESGNIVSGTIRLTINYGAGTVTAFGGNLTGASKTYGVSIVDNMTSLSSLLAGAEIAISATCSNCGAVTSLTGNFGTVLLGTNAEGALVVFGLNSADGTSGISGVRVGTGAGSYGPGGG